MKNMFPYIYDYISVLFESDELKRITKRIILFGSVARGDFDRESDVDVFLEVSSSLISKAEIRVKKMEKRFHIVSEKKWYPMGVKNPIKTIVGDLNEPMWNELRSEIISSGITLYGKFESMPRNLGHYSLFTYSLSGTPQHEKMRFLRMLFGYTIKKEMKTYRQTGILEGIGGKKLGPNTVLVPLERSREIQKLFSKFKIGPEIMEVWIKS